ncbi:hypothetical protein [Geomicrobium sp. JCM 19055]|uniref:hypothetical protein n=1 Tax=Geomicrobium sp. JCM 19055 TaxID=1460649 RepID=UPI00045EDD34|nr:hypothetical protein [Geomicrobium sp. JCM 19055]GAK00752.1 hypothetical protein JCM19055_3866 [Geomicrobium sp. JCM 19055]
MKSLIRSIVFLLTSLLLTSCVSTEEQTHAEAESSRTFVLSSLASTQNGAWEGFFCSVDE